MAMRLEGGHTESILSIDCSKDGTGNIITGSENGQICLWSLNGSMIGKVQLGEDREDRDVASVCFLRSKADLLFASAGASMHLLDRRQFNGPIESYNFNEDDINQIVVNEKEEFLASCDDSGEIKIVNVQTKRVFKTLRKHTNICAAVTFRPKRPWDLLSAGYDQRLMQWDFSRAKAVCDINISEVGTSADECDGYVVNPPFIHSMSLSSTGSLLACGTENALVHIFNASKKTLSHMTVLKGHTSGVSQVHFPSFDDYTLLSAGNDGICNLWNLNTVAVYNQCNGSSPANNGSSPANNGSSPANNGSSPANNGSSPANNGSSPANNGTASLNQSNASTVTTAASALAHGHNTGDSSHGYNTGDSSHGYNTGDSSHGHNTDYSSHGHNTDYSSHGDNTDDSSHGHHGPRPCYVINHDAKINWITSGATASRRFIVIADSTSEATVYTYPDH